MTDWLVWICDHSYISSWHNLMLVFIRKIYEFSRNIKEVDYKTHSHFKTKDQIEEASKLISKMLFFVEYYLPFQFFLEIQVIMKLLVLRLINQTL